jgi:hypothetical protein
MFSSIQKRHVDCNAMARVARPSRLTSSAPGVRQTPSATGREAESSNAVPWSRCWPSVRELRARERGAGAPTTLVHGGLVG